MDNVIDLIRGVSCVVVHRRESALVESDGGTDSRGVDVAEGYCLGHE